MTHRTTSPVGTPVPWYAMHPRHIRLRRVLLYLLICLALFSVNEKHVWQWAWQDGYHAAYNLRPVKDTEGVKRDAWRWVTGKEIRIYTSPEIADTHVQYAAWSVQELLDTLELDMQVRVMPPPPRVIGALAMSSEGMGADRHVDFDRLCTELISSRKGHYAEIVYARGIIDTDDDVVGAGVFSHGVGMLRTDRATALTARHEVAHMLGYHMHDIWPLAVIGYSNPLLAKYQHAHDTDDWLMMPYNDGVELSDRSRDALLHFWSRLERETGESLFTNAPAR